MKPVTRDVPPMLGGKRLVVTGAGAGIGEASCWLHSDASRNVSGQVQSVDGNAETLRTV